MCHAPPKVLHCKHFNFPLFLCCQQPCPQKPASPRHLYLTGTCAPRTGPAAAALLTAFLCVQLCNPCAQRDRSTGAGRGSKVLSRAGLAALLGRAAWWQGAVSFGRAALPHIIFARCRNAPRAGSSLGSVQQRCPSSLILPHVSHNNFFIYYIYIYKKLLEQTWDTSQPNSYNQK